MCTNGMNCLIMKNCVYVLNKNRQSNKFFLCWQYMVGRQFGMFTKLLTRKREKNDSLCCLYASVCRTITLQYKRALIKCIILIVPLQYFSPVFQSIFSICYRETYNEAGAKGFMMKNYQITTVSYTHLTLPTNRAE